MLIVERQNACSTFSARKQRGNAGGLARELSVSVSTIRRVSNAGCKVMVSRTHGGAMLRSDSAERRLHAGAADAIAAAGQPGVVLSEDMGSTSTASSRIGRYAATQVQPHMTVLLDGGSTASMPPARSRPGRFRSSPTACDRQLFSEDDEGVELICSVGRSTRSTGVMVGPIATGCLADLHADLLLFSLAGIYGDAAFNRTCPWHKVEQR